MGSAKSKLTTPGYFKSVLVPSKYENYSEPGAALLSTAKFAEFAFRWQRVRHELTSAQDLTTVIVGVAKCTPRMEEPHKSKNYALLKSSEGIVTWCTQALKVIDSFDANSIILCAFAMRRLKKIGIVPLSQNDQATYIDFTTRLSEKLHALAGQTGLAPKAHEKVLELIEDSLFKGKTAERPAPNAKPVQKSSDPV